jgi:hypothetical protein
MKIYIFIGFFLINHFVQAQELYVFTEPASNMASKSIGFRLNNFLMPDKYTLRTNYHLVPEIMLGVSKKIMVHGDFFFSNTNKKFIAEGGSIYAKYRFLSFDEVQKHFRVAGFARISLNNSEIHQQDINIYGHNSGWETGIVATQLLYKVALSSGISFVKAEDNGKSKFPGSADKALNYTLSIGKLMLPKEYKDYNQTNLNIMVESLNQLNLVSGRYYTDIAPSIQLIIHSQSRVDVGYRWELSSTYLRSESRGLFVRLEHNIFNAY